MGKIRLWVRMGGCSMKKALIGFGFAAAMTVAVSGYASEPIDEYSFDIVSVPSHQNVMFTIVEKDPQKRKDDAKEIGREVAREGIDIVRRKVPSKVRDRYDKAESIYDDIKTSIRRGKQDAEDILKI